MRISDWSSDVCSSDLLDAMAAQPRGALLGAGDGAGDAVADPRQRIDEVRHRRAGTDADHHAVLDVLDGLFAGQALGFGHGVYSWESRSFHSAAVTGITDNSAPLRTSANSQPTATVLPRSYTSGHGIARVRA